MLVYGLLAYVAVGASLILGVLYFMLREGRPVVKTIGVVVFVSAVYLQFFSGYPLAGLLLQTGLALSLELWRRTL